jgi:hypothetical protein
MVVAGACIVIAGAFAWKRDFSTAFVVATLGLVAWFFNYRIQMKNVADAAMREREANRSETEESDEIQ